MGVLHDDQRSFEFEDRLLTHLQIVVGVKLRRSECFSLSWLPGRETGAGRQSLWISTGTPLHFEFNGSRVPALNRDWIELLIRESGGGIGLNLSDDRSREPLAV
ncbi:hypothetical protein [Rathayibacter sp. VKM Ac-2801]|uniref:DUF7882 family protein n=1 Tax=Rathayibacter sp. VKM Ac-2801 TaxID=2609255 RepID=UPI00131F960C|nr:hypothetical protein [Rathayibacter sp. VKM Ac-2801]QHC69290.1 hypothetical protein GSU45_02085 [Rathayibacter sp. VKM Ac-2801]